MNKKDLKNGTGMLSGILAHFLVAVWMILIFYMSAQPGDLSGEISGGISHLFMKIWNGFFGLGWDEAEILHMAELWDYPIRKLAHMTEFGVLALLIYWMLGSYPNGMIGRLCGRTSRYVTAWIFTVIYAATDEIHQLFVPDRSGNGFDVCVDATGALLALLMLWWLPRMVMVCRRLLQGKRLSREKE